jgi:hypothetical protein
MEDESAGRGELKAEGLCGNEGEEHGRSGLSTELLLTRAGSEICAAYGLSTCAADHVATPRASSVLGDVEVARMPVSATIGGG